MCLGKCWCLDTLKTDTGCERWNEILGDLKIDGGARECKEAREGKVSKEEAIKRLKTGGIPENIVERVYESILNIDDKNDSNP